MMYDIIGCEAEPEEREKVGVKLRFFGMTAPTFITWRGLAGFTWLVHAIGLQVSQNSSEYQSKEEHPDACAPSGQVIGIGVIKETELFCILLSCVHYTASTTNPCSLVSNL